ncbi:MAG: NADPH-dependent reductase [Spirosoma sp.]|nr:NADPH-dependent reductase [Spirosoma sp.]
MMDMETVRKNVLAISGSTRKKSTNTYVIEWIKQLAHDQFEIEFFSQLDSLPHFNPDLDDENVPDLVAELRSKIDQADGVIICTPEYVFSLPGALKNALEWTVSTTVFSDKPVALITASGLGEKASEQLSLIMSTLGAHFDQQTQLLIQSARSKVDADSIDPSTRQHLAELINAFNDKITPKRPTF